MSSTRKSVVFEINSFCYTGVIQSDTFDSFFFPLPSLTSCIMCLGRNERTHIHTLALLLKKATWRAALAHHCDIEFGLKDDTFVNVLETEHTFKHC